MCGYYSLLLQGNGECELNNLAVLPEYRHKGIGRQLLAHSFNIAKELGCRIINIAIVEENRVLYCHHYQLGVGKKTDPNRTVPTPTINYSFFLRIL